MTFVTFISQEPYLNCFINPSREQIDLKLMIFEANASMVTIDTIHVIVISMKMCFCF